MVGKVQRKGICKFIKKDMSGEIKINEVAKNKNSLISVCLSKKRELGLNNAQFNSICRQEEVASFLRNNNLDDLKRLKERLRDEIIKSKIFNKKD